jgi:hypothetical protein
VCAAAAQEPERNLIEEAEADLASGDVNQAAAKFSEAMQKDKDKTHLAFAGLGMPPLHIII